MDTGERKTISLESGAYEKLIAVNSTVAIIYSTNIIIWEPNSGSSWRVETSVIKWRVWAYDLDPVGHVISRIYFDKAVCAMWQEQFPYGVKKEESYSRSWVLKRAPEYSNTPVETVNNINGLDRVSVLQNLRGRVWGRQFFWDMEDGSAMLSLAYDYNQGEWKVREITAPNPKLPHNLPHQPDFYQSRAYVLEDATAFLSSNLGISSVDIYLWDEERWVKWEEGWQSMPNIIIEDMSPRHVVIILKDKGSVEVRRFMGIHERKALEGRYRGKVEDAYGTLLKRGSGKGV